MNWHNHKKNERHSFMIPSEHRDILLRPWRSIIIILGAEVWRMLSVVLSSNAVNLFYKGFTFVVPLNHKGTRVTIGQNYRSAKKTKMFDHSQVTVIKIQAKNLFSQWKCIVFVIVFSIQELNTLCRIGLYGNFTGNFTDCLLCWKEPILASYPFLGLLRTNPA